MSDIVYKTLEQLEQENAALRTALESVFRLVLDNYVRAIELGDFEDGAKWIRDGKFWESDADVANDALREAGYTKEQTNAMLNEVRLEISEEEFDEMEEGSDDAN